MITRRASREDTASFIAIATEPVAKIVGLSNFKTFSLVHALVIYQLKTERHIIIVELF